VWRNFSHLRLPADTKACGVGKASRKAHALGIDQSSKASRAALVIFAQGALELIDECGALFDQGDLVAAE
jgi:hypothetical protein